MDASNSAHSPYHHFTTQQWAALRADEPMTLTADDVLRLRALNDPISHHEAEQVYLPLARLMSLYFEAAGGLHQAAVRFLGTDPQPRMPFVIGVCGSVAVGKSTTARILQALLQRWPTSPKVDLVTTDGFLYANEILEQRNLMNRKGFPESYDCVRFTNFLLDIKSGRRDIPVPIYSHLVYDVVPGEEIIVDRPDILIVEGLNILQPSELPAGGGPIVFASDYLDFSIYLDAAQDDLLQWFVDRFHRLRETAFKDPSSFFHKYSKFSDQEAVAMATSVWNEINLPNLVENILPTRGRADLILKKDRDHSIGDIALRRL